MFFTDTGRERQEEIGKLRESLRLFVELCNSRGRSVYIDKLSAYCGKPVTSDEPDNPSLDADNTDEDVPLSFLAFQRVMELHGKAPSGDYERDLCELIEDARSDGYDSGFAAGQQSAQTAMNRAMEIEKAHHVESGMAGQSP